MKFSFITHRKIWYSISAFLCLSSVIVLAAYGLRLGIDFTGGSLWEGSFEKSVQTSELKSTFVSFGYDEAVVQSSGEKQAIVRLRSLGESEHQEFLKKIQSVYPNTQELKFDSIGPVIGQELKRTSTIGVVVILVLIGLYVAYAFKSIQEPVSSWKYGLLTILTAFHDVIIPLGVFSILGRFYHWELDTAIIAAILTVLGYSITDTIVVFDRTRENWLKKKHGTFEETVEQSIRQTCMRSLSTSITTLLALFAIFFFGGESTKPFALALIIGISAGTYSSIFLASPMLVTLVDWKSLKTQK